MDSDNSDLDSDEMNMSVVEEKGKGVLDWTICKGKAS